MPRSGADPRRPLIQSDQPAVHQRLPRKAGHSLNASTQSEMRFTTGTSISRPQAPEWPVRDQSFQYGTTSSTIGALSALAGIFTYSTSFTATAISSGTYGNIVTYTATTL